VQNPIFNIRGQNLSQRESGVFHYNVNGHIEMLKNEENPRMFVNFDLQKVKAKRILFYFDISGSMSSINKTLKPILKFVIDYKVKNYFNLSYSILQHQSMKKSFLETEL